MLPDLTGHSAPFSVLQDDTASMIVDNPPFFDLLQGSKAADADEVIVQAAISDARGSSRAVDVTH
jgi:hypothetical protein